MPSNANAMTIEMERERERKIEGKGQIHDNSVLDECDVVAKIMESWDKSHTQAYTHIHAHAHNIQWRERRQ